jgi:hypothetical protein
MTSKRNPPVEDREQTLEEHRQIAEITGSIPEILDRVELSALLGRLELLLERHFQREEQQEGLHEDIKTRSPRFAASLHELAKQHRGLMRTVGELRAQAQECPDELLTGVQSDCQEFMERLREHEAWENALFLDSISTT